MSAERQDGSFTGEGGLDIHWQAWLPDAEPRAVVLLAHGAGEHSGRYGHVGDRLANAGYAVYALDHRGHGRSQGPRALIDRLDHAVADLHALAELAGERHAGTPVFLLGHSMGGGIALEYALRHQDELAGLLLSAPLAALEAASALTLAAGRALSVIAPRAGVYGVDPTLVSRDPEVVRAYEEDPLVHHGKLPARTVAELAAAIGSFPERVPQLHLPLLVMHGTADKLTPPSGSDMVHERAGSKDETIVRYDGLYHELLNEPEREQVMDEIVGWLDARV